jgi:soluble lytic murein transglycosylase-like protein
MGITAELAANCWLAAASAFDLPPGLLYAVAEVESAFNPAAVAHANNGTHSVGVMQINSSWFAKLADLGISERALLDPCTNIRVGGWILAQGVRRYGYSWEAIGAYYAGPFDGARRRWRLQHYHGYANRVLEAWQRLKDRSADTSTGR